nr:AHH domain-containing protein [Pyxidicoccus fallax]
MFLQSKPGDGPQPVKKPPCEYCGKQGHPFAPSWGSSIGSSGILRDNILKGHEADVHPWYTGRWSIAAHHLICSEAMADDEVWARFCREFGYDLNRAQNGVILPMVLAVACELHVPVHVGPHAGGWAFDMDLAYPEAVKARLAKVARAVGAGGFCSSPSTLTDELDRLSAEILGRIATGRWTLTRDGQDYLPGGVGHATRVLRPHASALPAAPVIGMGPGLSPILESGPRRGA